MLGIDSRKHWFGSTSGAAIIHCNIRALPTSLLLRETSSYLELTHATVNYGEVLWSASRYATYVFFMPSQNRYVLMTFTLLQYMAQKAFQYQRISALRACGPSRSAPPGAHIVMIWFWSISDGCIMAFHPA